MNFKVGDRVEFIAPYSHQDEKIRQGLKGYVLYIENTLTVRNLAVEFDEEIVGGHSCNGQGKRGHCWWVNEISLEAPSSLSYEDVLI